MSRAMLVWFGVFVVLSAAAGFCLAMALQASRQTVVASNAPNVIDEPRHPVTDDMWKASRATAGKPAPDFRLDDLDGRSVRLSDLTPAGPVVLVFVKDGCPCSMEAQPFFNELAKGYAGKATFVGIINVPRVPASKWRDDFRVVHPLLLAGDGAVYKAYGAKQSVYTTLVGPGGTVVKQWPGFSKASLKELDSLVAEAANTKPVGVDATMAPEKMTSGCLFDE